MVKDGLFYTEDHEWVKIDGQTATVGISDHAQDALGEVTFIELPEAGKEVNAKDQLASAESSKAASDIYAPVAGKVTEVNQKLQDQPELINNDCYGDGWIAKLEISGDVDTSNLMDAQQYEKFLQS